MIRQSFLFLALAALLLPGTLSADLRKTAAGPLGDYVAAPDQQIFANVLGFLYGTPTIGYETVLGRDNSITGQIGFRTYGSGGYGVSFLSLLGSYRWWLGQHAKMQGVYLGPMLSVSMVNVNYDWVSAGVTKKESVSTTAFGLGAEAGYQWILTNQLTFSAGLNAGFSFGSLSLNTGAPSIPFGGLGAGLSGTVGYAF